MAQELEAQFQREKIRFDDFGEKKGPTTAVLSCTGRKGEKVEVKILSEPEDFAPGICYRFFGSWQDSKYGKQFAAKTFVRATPFGRSGVVAYLKQAQGIGASTANKLFDAFQGDAIRILREEPNIAGAVKGVRIGEEKLRKASEDLQRMARTEAATVELLELFNGRGFPRDLPKRLIRDHKNEAAEKVKESPFMLLDYAGCGFVRVDALYIDLGHDAAAIDRQALCAWHSLLGDRDGHTWLRPGVIEEGLRSRISGPLVDLVGAIREAVDRGIIEKYRSGSHWWFADGRRARNERRVADRVAKFMLSTSDWPDAAKLEDVSEHQREAAIAATAAPVSILTGGPGTGKTFTAARIIRSLLRKDGDVAVAAPTGKAAVRISEVLEGYGISIKARTIHSLLGVASHSESGGWTFKHNEENPLPFRWIVVDEASMIDADLMASLVSACGPGTHILFVGDVGQLPPVGHGAPLRDFIRYGVPAGELTEFRRNSGDIVAACHKIRNGEKFETSKEWKPSEGKNLRLLNTIAPEATISKIVTAIKRIASARIADPIAEVQVVVAVNDKSPLARSKLNKILQAELNPSGRSTGANPFRTGDKIVCLKNGNFPAVPDAPEGFNEGKAEDGTVRVANGEQARVKIVEEKRTIAQLDAPNRLIVIPRGSSKDSETGSGCDFDLAYAISCHKSQGSEWPVIFVALDEYPGARMLCSREWLYTAMSRAKTACLLVGRIETAYAMTSRRAIDKRKTFLPEFIEQATEYLRNDEVVSDWQAEDEEESESLLDPEVVEGLNSSLDLPTVPEGAEDVS